MCNDIDECLVASSGESYLSMLMLEYVMQVYFAPRNAKFLETLMLRWVRLNLSNCESWGNAEVAVSACTQAFKSGVNRRKIR